MVLLAKQLEGLRTAIDLGPRLSGLDAMVQEHAQTLRNAPSLFEEWATSERVSPRQVVELRAMCAHLMAIGDAYAPMAQRIAAHLDAVGTRRPERPFVSKSGRRIAAA